MDDEDGGAEQEQGFGDDEDEVAGAEVEHRLDRGADPEGGDGDGELTFDEVTPVGNGSGASTGNVPPSP